jgi:hypothetical protein
MGHPFRVSGIPLFVGPEDEMSIVPVFLHIHVADTMPRDILEREYKVLWFPINEIGPWSYSTFYAVKKVLDEYLPIARKWFPSKYIYLSCAGGANRSPMMAYCWLLSRNYDQDEICDMMRDPNGFYAKKYRQQVGEGIIPADLMEFYGHMHRHPTWCVMSILQTMDKTCRLAQKRQ